MTCIHKYSPIFFTVVEEISDLVGELEQRLQAANILSENKVILDKIREKCKQVENEQSLDDIKAAFDSAKEIIPKLMSADPEEITNGLLQLVSAFAPLVGPDGVIIACLSSILSGSLDVKLSQSSLFICTLHCIAL